MKKFSVMATLAFIAAFVLLGIISIIGFISSGMWHCLILALMAAGMVWALYREDCTEDNK